MVGRVGVIILKPKTNDKDYVVLSEKGREMIEEALEAERRGEVIGPFSNVKEALKALNSYIFIGTLTDENITLIGYGQSVYALNQKTGELLWNFEAYELKEIIIDKNDRAIYVHDETDVHRLGFDGRETWKYAHHEIIVQIEIDKDAIILSDLDDQKYRVDPKTGKIQ